MIDRKLCGAHLDRRGDDRVSGHVSPSCRSAALRETPPPLSSIERSSARWRVAPRAPRPRLEMAPLRRLVEIADFAGRVRDPAADKAKSTVRRVLRNLMRYKPSPGDGHTLRRAIVHAAPLAQEVRAPLVDSLAGVVEWFWELRPGGLRRHASGAASFTVDVLSAELRVNRRSIERAIEAGTIVPTARTASGRARFSAEYVECLKARAAAARMLGHKYLMASFGLPPEQPKRNAAQFVERILWKRRHLHRHTS